MFSRSELDLIDKIRCSYHSEDLIEKKHMFSRSEFDLIDKIRCSYQSEVDLIDENNVFLDRERF